MRAVDTNVVVRLLVRDDEPQYRATVELLQQAEAANEPLLIPDLVLAEVLWVLRSNYHFDRAEVLEALALIAAMPVFRFESYPAILALLARGLTSNADIADLLIGIGAAEAGCDTTLTFDRALSRTGLFALVPSP